MNQYLLLIQGNVKSETTADDWKVFFAAAKESGLFRGGSEIGERVVVGDTLTAQPSSHIVGYMRFDSDDETKLLELIRRHPVVLRGGSVELCKMPKT